MGTNLRTGTQGGQSLLEALVVLGVLGSLWLGIAWLGRLQDIGLQLSHASRRAAFAHAHQGLATEDLRAGADGYLGPAGQRWQTRQGHALLPDGILLRIDSLAQTPLRQIGDPVAGADAMRRELQLGDAFVWRAQASTLTRGSDSTRGQLRDFDQQALHLSRHTAIMRGTGAASDDAAVQRLLGGSPQAWAGRASTSLGAGRDVHQRLHGVDTAWGRAQPSWDWLSPWTSWVPAQHLKPWSQP